MQHPPSMAPYTIQVFPKLAWVASAEAKTKMETTSIMKQSKKASVFLRKQKKMVEDNQRCIYTNFFTVMDFKRQMRRLRKVSKKHRKEHKK